MQGRGRTAIVADECFEGRTFLKTMLQSEGFAVRLAENGNEVLSLLREDSSVSLVLLDVRMPEKNGVDTLCELRREHRKLPVILVSGRPVSQAVLNTIQEHEARYIDKTFLPERLMIALESDLPDLQSPSGRDLFLGTPKADQAGSRSFLGKIANLIKQVGHANVPVLLQGETGVGKEVLARSIHASSPRAKKPFVKINCAAFPSDLVESELFGHERGAFSGAVAQRQGLFETAHGGTILLDEIGDMEIHLQAKLLQVLQDGEFRRIGGRELVRVDVRIMAATHQNLRQSIVDGLFREDLYYRLNVVNLEIPPLRERREEILSLAEYFLRKYQPIDRAPLSIPPILSDAMLSYAWPGNVRELENTMRRYLILRDPFRLSQDLRSFKPNREKDEQGLVADQDENQSDGGPDHGNALQRAEQAKREAESEVLLAALESTHWNRKKAAELLSVDYKAFLYKMKKLGLDAQNKTKRKGSATEGKWLGSLSA